MKTVEHQRKKPASNGNGTKAKSKTPAVVLEEGQVWKLEDCLIQIVSIGKNLTHYKRFNSINQKGVPTKLERTRTVETYLKTKKATLFKNPKAEGGLKPESRKSSSSGVPAS